MKGVARNGEQCLKTKMFMVMGILSWLKASFTAGRGYPIRQLVLCERDFGCLGFVPRSGGDRFDRWQLLLVEETRQLKASMTVEGGPCPS